MHYETPLWNYDDHYTDGRASRKATLRDPVDHEFIIMVGMIVVYFLVPGLMWVLS